MATCFVTQLSFAVFVTMPFTTFVYMVQDFYPDASPAVNSRRTGLLASLSNLSMFFTSIPWGLVTDRRGRRGVLNVGNWTASASVLLLGLQHSFAGACACRVVGGLLNGTLVTMKAVIADVTDDTNAARAFSLLSVAWGVGAILGPVLGGLLSRPCREGGVLAGAASCVPGSILGRQPYLLPCLTSSLMCAIAGALSLKLPETMRKATSQKPAQQQPCLVGDGEEQPLLLEVEMQDAAPTPGPDASPPLGSDAAPAVAAPTTVRWFRDSQCVLCLLGYTLCAFIFIQLDELLPLFAADGLNMSPRGLSAPLAFGGAVVLSFTLFCYPLLVRHAGLRASTRGGFVATSVSTLIVPVASLATSIGLRNTILYIGIATRGIAAVVCFTGSMILVNKAAPGGQLGEVNGMGQCLAALVRGLGPAIAGVEWAASLKGPAGAQFAPFVSIAAMALLGTVLYGRVDFDRASSREPTGEAVVE
jgi:MFS family permease